MKVSLILTLAASSMVTALPLNKRADNPYLICKYDDYTCKQEQSSICQQKANDCWRTGDYQTCGPLNDLCSQIWSYNGDAQQNQNQQPTNGQGSSSKTLPPTNGQGSSSKTLPPTNGQGSSSKTLPPTNGQGSSSKTLPPTNGQGSSSKTLPPTNGQGSSSKTLPPNSTKTIPNKPEQTSSNPSSPSTDDYGSCAADDWDCKNKMAQKCYSDLQACWSKPYSEAVAAECNEINVKCSKIYS